jgi:hypothetical protein
MDSYSTPTSFIAFLRWSYYRPRDIVTMLQILQDIAKNGGSGSTEQFFYEQFDSAEFKRRYSDYLLGELKDHLTFYYGVSEYDRFLKFFEFLNGQDKFTFEEYLASFTRFQAAIGMAGELPKFMTTPMIFLQFLYDLNVICYMERPEDDKPYVRWCFRERSYGNISPKVKEGVEYQVFYGLAKALNVGQKFKPALKSAPGKGHGRGR